MIYRLGQLRHIWDIDDPDNHKGNRSNKKNHDLHLGVVDEIGFDSTLALSLLDISLMPNGCCIT